MVNNYMKSGSRTLEYAYHRKFSQYSMKNARLQLASKNEPREGSSNFKTSAQDLQENMDILYLALISPPGLWKKSTPQMHGRVRYVILKFDEHGHIRSSVCPKRNQTFVKK